MFDVIISYIYKPMRVVSQYIVYVTYISLYHLHMYHTYTFVSSTM